MSGSRGRPRGPGGAPLTEKREQFVRLISRGVGTVLISSSRLCIWLPVRVSRWLMSRGIWASIKGHWGTGFCAVRRTMAAMWRRSR